MDPIRSSFKPKHPLFQPLRERSGSARLWLARAPFSSRSQGVSGCVWTSAHLGNSAALTPEEALDCSSVVSLFNMFSRSSRVRRSLWRSRNSSRNCTAERDRRSNKTVRVRTTRRNNSIRSTFHPPPPSILLFAAAPPPVVPAQHQKDAELEPQRPQRESGGAGWYKAARDAASQQRWGAEETTAKIPTLIEKQISKQIHPFFKGQ